MKIVIITGSAGLVGSQTARRFHQEGYFIVGIDNNMRAKLFGSEASTDGMVKRLRQDLRNYEHHNVDIRNNSQILDIFEKNVGRIALVVHTAAQPSHDWAAREPHTDFGINACGTMNILEAARANCPEAPFIFTSTNKVYGDTPNQLPLVECSTRWEICKTHVYCDGISEDMPIDRSKHSLFGASKLSADILVQEYGKYFGMPTVCFRGGCLTGPAHAATELHGFLAYLMKCTVQGLPYRIFGYKGKQVRDNIHSSDLVEAFWQFYKSPRCGEVYNMGGSRHSHSSLLEAISLCEQICNRKLKTTYVEKPRIGDHIWYVTNVEKFKSHYPKWRYRYTFEELLSEIATTFEKQKSKKVPSKQFV